MARAIRGASGSGRHRNGEIDDVNPMGSAFVDREGLCALLLLFFTDAARHARLQKILVGMCANRDLCQFTVAAALAIIGNMPTDDEQQHIVTPTAHSWLDSLTIDTGLGNRASRLYLSETKHSDNRIHPLIAEVVARGLLDLLIAIAEAYPQYVIPEFLRASNSAALNDFFSTLRAINALELRKAAVNGHNASSTAFKDNRGALSTKLASDAAGSPLALIIQYGQHPFLRKNTLLANRIMKLV